MSHEETDWRPKGAVEHHNGFEVYDHGIWPHEVNRGEVDGDISFDESDDE
ncbi:MAG: hypothetical protein ABEJ05_09650 [Haloglomus sp.]